MIVRRVSGCFELSWFLGMKIVKKVVRSVSVRKSL